MSSTAELRHEIATVRDDVIAALSKAQDRAIIGKVNEEKLAKLDGQLNSYISLSANLRESINHIVAICKNVESYVNEKKKANLSKLKDAVSTAGSIVPDADMRGVYLDYTEGKARVMSRTGQDVNEREGSALRATMSTLMRYTLTKAQPSALPALLLDEAFATLSDITSSYMRNYLKEFSKDMLIVGIEQRKVLFEGITDVEVQFFKQNGQTKVRVSNNQDDVNDL